MEGKKPWRAAAIEAFEEAGIDGDISKDRIGIYKYRKKLSSGAKVKCKVSLYPMQVERLRTKWPEKGQRRRKWFSPKNAARMVKEPELKAILKSFASQRKKKSDFPIWLKDQSTEHLHRLN